MKIEQLDLNLLVVFQHLLEQRSVSKAARTLGMSQPALSSALGRLRSSLGDELFVRTPRGMQPTSYALSLTEPIADALRLLYDALNLKPEFDPATSERNFGLALSDVGEIYFLPVLLKTLAKVAPRVTLQCSSVSLPSLKDELTSGHIDLAIGLLPQLQSGFVRQGLFRQKYVCLMSKAHPMAKFKQFGSKEFFEAEHVRVLATGTGHGSVDIELDQLRLSRKVRITLGQYFSLSEVLKDTDLIATVPERFADQVVKAGYCIKRDLPVRVKQTSIHQCWHSRVHRDPGHQWLRKTISGLFADHRLAGDTHQA